MSSLNGSSALQNNMSASIMEKFISNKITQIMQVLKMLPLIYFQLRVYCNALLCTTNTMSRSSGTLRRHFEDGKYVVFGQCLFGILYT